MRWFRWHHDSCEDLKFRMVARVTDVTVRDVIALWAALLESASRNAPRGIVTNDRLNFIEVVLDLPSELMGRMCAAMEDAQLIERSESSTKILNWGKRQFDTDLHDGTNAARQKRYRDRKRQRNGAQNGTVTPQIQITDTEPEKKDSAASAAPVDLLQLALPTPAAEPTPSKSGNPPKRKAREPNLAAGDALATRDDGGFSTRKGGWLSFEEVFEDLRAEAAQRGLPYSLTGRLQSAMGNFERSYDALKTGLGKTDPRKYVAGAVHRREAELAHEGAAVNGHAKQLPGDPKETPQWILDRRAAGDVIVREGKSWRWEGGLFDDAGNETGF